MTPKKRKRIVAWALVDAIGDHCLYHNRADANHYSVKGDKFIKLVEADPVRERLIRDLVEGWESGVKTSNQNTAALRLAGIVAALWAHEKGKR